MADPIDKFAPPQTLAQTSLERDRQTFKQVLHNQITNARYAHATLKGLAQRQGITALVAGMSAADKTLAKAMFAKSRDIITTFKPGDTPEAFNDLPTDPLPPAPAPVPVPEV